MKELIQLKSFPIEPALKILLEDKTTKKNIIWATKSYEEYGNQYSDKLQINLTALTVLNPFVIQPRIMKALSEQQERTKKHAEVFTPSWICNKMNNYCDEEWFARKDVFNVQKGQTWEPVQGIIKFDGNTTWQNYVDSRRLEITCGETPYLVSRYDTSTGNIIDIKNRIGILDRKLRIVGENTDNEAEWLKWTTRAFQSVYGYEYQGDNLLIGRINLLATFDDYLKTKWNREATNSELKKIANIISWNLWQMNGLSDRVPLGIPPIEYEQLSLFDSLTNEDEQEKPPVCIIKDWKRKNSVRYNLLKKESENTMKFDFVIGNPPYQDKSDGDKKADASVYHYFIDEAYKVGNKIELITPARFLFDNGNTPKKWNRKMLSDPHFKVLFFESDGNKVFANHEIKGGIAIHYRDEKEDYGAIEQYTSFPELNSILKKVLNKKEPSITTIIYNQNKFNLTRLYEVYPKLKSTISSEGKEKRLTSGCISYKCFHTEKKSKDDVKVLGIISNKRCYKFINKNYLELPHPNFEKYKVIVPANNGSGAIGEVLSTPLIGTPLIGYTQTFISFGAFENEKTANNALKYIKSKFARTMLGILKVTQNGKKDTWKYVPLQDFTSSSDIDWKQSIRIIDKQLYKKYNLTKEEIEFIETKVKEME